MTVRLRRARADDRKPVFEWRNDPWIVSLSDSQRAIEWDEHVSWFDAMLASPDHLFLVVESDAGAGMGVVRLERRDATDARVTVYLLRPFVGRGLGVEALRRGVAAAFEAWPALRTIHAVIRPDNEPSRRAFARAGFRATPDGAPGGLVEMVRERTGESAVDDNARIADFYAARLRQFGVDPRALDWGSAESQQRRFAVLSQIGTLDGASLLDVGCGLADLLGYLRREGVRVDYTGYDVSPAMVDAARQRFPGASIHLRDLLDEAAVAPRFDWVVASGIFYLRQVDPLAYLEAMTRRMFALCRRGVAFNTLSAAAPSRAAGEFHADPAAVLRRCLGITPRVVLRHDYAPHDFTVYLYREVAE